MIDFYTQIFCSSYFYTNVSNINYFIFNLIYSKLFVLMVEPNIHYMKNPSNSNQIYFFHEYILFILSKKKMNISYLLNFTY